MWAAGAESDGDAVEVDATGAEAGAARPDGAAPADDAVLARPRHLLDSPSASVSATLSNSSSIASEKDEPKPPGVAAELVSKLPSA